MELWNGKQLLSGRYWVLDTLSSQKPELPLNALICLVGSLVCFFLPTKGQNCQEM